MAEGAEGLRKNWLASLAHERRASPHTLRAYGDDMARFIGFQAGHTGGAMTEKALAKLSPADIRAFITVRRGEGLGPGGVQRALAAVRSFYKFLAKEGILENAAARSIRTPRVRRGLPRPLSVSGDSRSIATIPADVFKKLLSHPLTDKGLAAFNADAKKAGVVIKGA